MRNRYIKKFSIICFDMGLGVDLYAYIVNDYEICNPSDHRSDTYVNVCADIDCEEAHKGPAHIG